MPAGVAVSIVLIVAACAARVGAQQALTVQRLAWLQGCWQATLGPSIVEEHWMGPRGGTMIGTGRTVRGEATSEYELVIVKEQDGRLAYEAHPSGQPSAVFLSKDVTETSIVFENLQHDFPQRVGYRRTGSDLMAWVEGIAKGKERRIEFPYRRVSCDGP